MLDSYRDLIDGLLESPNVVRGALGDPVPDDIAPELATLLRELSAREAVNLRRCQAVMRRENVMLLAFEDEREMKALADSDGRSASPEENLASFSHDRSELISLLVNLTLSDWDRPVNHDRSGDTTLAEEIEDHLTWDETIVPKLTTA